MSVQSTDILFKHSGGAANADPNASLGGVISSVSVTDNTLLNLFDNVTGDEHTVGDTEYRCFYVKNNSAETAYNVKIWIETNTQAADDTLNIGKETVIGSPVQVVANESTAPTGISFLTAAGQSNAILLGDMTAGTVYGIWLKRIVSPGSTAQASNSAQIKIYVDTL